MITYTLIWTAAAMGNIRRLLIADAQSAKDVRVAIRSLIQEPYPGNSTPLAVPTLRRLKTGASRIVYEIDETHRSVTILTVGRVTG